MIVFPGAISGAIAAPFIGRLIDRYGNLTLILIGQFVLITGSMMFGLLSTKASVFILLTYLCISLGFSTLNSCLSNEVTRILPLSDIGVGAGMIQLIQYFGGAFGVTLSSLLLTFQEGLFSEFVYRNIFLSISLLVFCSMITFYFYFRKVKIERLI